MLCWYEDEWCRCASRLQRVYPAHAPSHVRPPANYDYYYYYDYYDLVRVIRNVPSAPPIPSTPP